MHGAEQRQHLMSDAHMVGVLYSGRNSSFAGTDLGTLHEGSSHDHCGSNSVQLFWATRRRTPAECSTQCRSDSFWWRQSAARTPGGWLHGQSAEAAGAAAAAAQQAILQPAQPPDVKLGLVSQIGAVPGRAGF